MNTKMNSSNILILFIMVTLVYLNESLMPLPNCHQIGFDNCLKRNFFSIGRREDVSFLVTTKNGFDQLCRRFNESLSCIEKHFKACAPPFYAIIFRLITEEMQIHFRDYICDHSNSQRRDYFKHSECYRKFVFANDNAITCLNNYLLAFEHIERTLYDRTSNLNNNNNNGIHENAIITWRRIICCAHERKRECTRKLAIHYCGENADEPFDRFFEQIHFGFFQIVCNIGTMMKPNSSQCNDETMPDWQQQPDGLESHSAISRLLVSYFPFNYIHSNDRTNIYRLYKKLSSVRKNITIDID